MEGNERHYFLPYCYYDKANKKIVDTSTGNEHVISGLQKDVLEVLIKNAPGWVYHVEIEDRAGIAYSKLRQIISSIYKFDPGLMRKIINNNNKGYYRVEKMEVLEDHEVIENRVQPPYSADNTQNQEYKIRPNYSSCTLTSTRISLRPYFVAEAREEIFDEIDAKFMESNVVFLCGIGGIGKSEIAKYWAQKKQKLKLFTTVVFAQLNSDTNISNVQSLINNDMIFTISDFGRNDGEPDDVYFNRKLTKIRQIAKEETLIIIDNFDLDDPLMRQLLTGQYSLLVTTRNDPKKYGLPIVKVEEIKNVDHLKKIFFNNMEGERPEIRWDDPFIEKLFSLVSNHTLAIEIIAKFLAYSKETPETLHQKMSSPKSHKLISNMEGGLIEQNYSEEQLSPIECIRRLFKISHIENEPDFDSKEQVLTFMAAMPTSGIERRRFDNWCDQKTKKARADLVRKNWLQRDMVDNKVEMISMHPLIRELVWLDRMPSLDKCGVIKRGFIADDYLYIDGLYHQPKDVKIQYEQVALSLLSAFPVQNLDEFDFFIKLQRLLHTCANAAKALSLAQELEQILKDSGQVDSWRYGLVNFRIGVAYATLLRDRDKSLEFLKTAEMLMEKHAQTNEDKMWLALLYREIASIDCQDRYLFKRYNQIYGKGIEDRLEKGNVLVGRLINQGFSNSNLEIYPGTLFVWQSKLAVARNELKQAEELLKKAEKEFNDHGYANVLDKTAVADIRALIHAKNRDYGKEIKSLQEATRVFEAGFGKNHRASVERAIKLAIAYMNNGEHEKAKDLLSEYKTILEDVCGEKALLTVEIQGLLAKLNNSVGF